MLVAYAKLALKKDILASDLPDDPYFAATLAALLPAGAARDVCRGAGASTRCGARSSRTRS